MAGVISDVGDGYATSVQVGDAVIVRGSFACLAEEIVADLANVFPIPAPEDWGAAAALSVAYTTAYHALVHRGGLKAGETVLVLGARWWRRMLSSRGAANNRPNRCRRE